jgi:nitrous oxidase accessory protein
VKKALTIFLLALVSFHMSGTQIVVQAGSSISNAVAIANPYDTILVHEGTYPESQIIITTPLTLLSKGQVVIDGEGNGEIIRIEADSVTIKGFDIRNTGSSYLEDQAAIHVYRAQNFKLLDNVLTNTFFGIYLSKSSNGLIKGNSVNGNAKQEMNSGNAIHIWHCQQIEVISNFVQNHRDGIYLEFVDSSSVESNISENNLRYGLHFMFSNNDRYSKNTFRKNGAGVAVMFSKFIEMESNRFENNWGAASYGLLLKEIYDAVITDNVFIKNTIGIHVDGSTRIEYRHNDFINNGWAVKMAGGCLDNVITENNFIANTFDLIVSSAVNNNTFNGNYWTGYSGYDLDRDGKGDVPYRPVKLFSFVLEQSPEAVVLLRSFFVDLVNFSESVNPSITPAEVFDDLPGMRRFE